MKIKKVVSYLDDNRFPYLEVEETCYDLDASKAYDSPEVIYGLAKDMRITERATEMVLLLIFDSAMQLLCVHEVSTGSINRNIVPVREIVQTVLLAGGVSCAMLHNHPSGNTSPSDMDIAVSQTVKKGLELLQMRLLDHLVVGRCGYTSLAESELL